ncbi:MAG: VIT domain-containing protein [Leptolinea sp.]
MKSNWVVSCILAIAFLVSNASSALADGIIIPEPPFCDPGPCRTPIVPISRSPLAIKNHIVTVKIEDQLAVTHVDQVFVNTGNTTVEGTYVFPLPLDAVVQRFILWVDGKPVEGKVLTAEEARRTYEDIVRSMRDPALLEYIGRGAVQASIFPIPAGGERRVELEYTQALSADNGLVKYSYPLNTEKFSALPLDKVSVTVELETTSPIRAVYSPSHSVDVARTNPTSAIASYEASNIKPDADFNLFYSFGEQEAMHLFTFRDGRDPSDPDGFFLLLAAPRPDETAERVAKDILLIIDRSGSMDGEKMQQAKTAARYVLSHLGPDDRFHITTFSSSVNHFASGMSPASAAGAASKWIDALNASGSTDINRALLEAVDATDTERPTYLLFLTDGLPTVGVRESSQILENFKRTARSNIRMFPFGVGFDVDTLLLDTLSQEHHGASSYVKPGEALDEMLSGFYEKISTPVLTNLELEVDGVTVYDLYPEPLPDLFQGSKLVITGRYRNGGNAEIILSGQTNDLPQTYRYSDMQFTEESSSTPGAESSLPRLWAARKIGTLLNKIRLEGNDRETIDQIVKLSIRYGIVTPYTSYLVTEPLALGAVEQERLSAQTFNDMQAMPAPSVSGSGAVQKAQEQNALSQAEAAPSLSQEAGQTIKTVGARTFVLKDNVWMDTTYDPGKMTVKKIKFLSDEYFQLVKSRADMAARFAIDIHVVVVDGASAIEIIE